jgi:hypothetical protein
MSISEYHTKLQELVSTADSIAWDGCHKIYIQQDQQQTDKMKNYGYDYLWTKDMMDTDSMVNTIYQWWRQSCGLRLVDSVSTGHRSEDLFTTVVPQS